MLSATDADKSAGPPRALEQAEDELSKSIKAAQEVVKDAKWAFSQQAQAKRAAKAANAPASKAKAKSRAKAKSKQ